MTPSELAGILEMPLAPLGALSRAAHRLYYPRPVSKKSGAIRQTWAPHKTLKDKQRLRTERILNKLPLPSLLYGGPGTSQISAAQAHREQPIVITVDLTDFFPSIRRKQVFAALTRAGIPTETSDIICRLCTRKNVLPQGAPSSPVIARLVIAPALLRIEKAIKQVSPHCRLTQYVDDLAISGPVGLKKMVPLVSTIFRQSGFTVNQSKTRVMKRDSEQIVLGICVNNRRLDVPKAFKDRIASEATATPVNRPRLAGLRAWAAAVRDHG